MGVFRILRTWLVGLGRERVEVNRARYRAATEALRGIKEIRITGMESAFVASFASSAQRFARIQTGTQVVGQLPRSVLEALAFGGMVAMIIYLLASGLGVETVLPTMGVFAFAAYRLCQPSRTSFQGRPRFALTQDPSSCW